MPEQFAASERKSNEPTLKQCYNFPFWWIKVPDGEWVLYHRGHFNWFNIESRTGKEFNSFPTKTKFKKLRKPKS